VACGIYRLRRDDRQSGSAGDNPELAQTWIDEAERVVKMLTDAGYEVKGWPDGR